MAPGAGGSRREAAAPSRSRAPESRLANCFVREGPWVTPCANGTEEQKSKAEETGGSKGKVKWQLSRTAINQGLLERPRSSTTERSDMFMPQMKKLRSPNGQFKSTPLVVGTLKLGASFLFLMPLCLVSCAEGWEGSRCLREARTTLFGGGASQPGCLQTLMGSLCSEPRSKCCRGGGRALDFAFQK